MGSWALFLKYQGRVWWSCTYRHSVRPTLRPSVPQPPLRPVAVKRWLHFLVLFNAFSRERPAERLCIRSTWAFSVRPLHRSLAPHRFSTLSASPDLLHQLFVITVIWTTCRWPPTHQTQMTSFPLYKTLNCFQVLSMIAFSGWPLGSRALVLAKAHLNH